MHLDGSSSSNITIGSLTFLTFNSKEDHDKFMKRINQMPDSASALANRKIAKEAGVSIQWGKDHARAKK